MSEFPKFDGFLKSITPEQCKEIEKRLAYNIEEVRKDFETNEFAAITSAMNGHNFRMMLCLLELYHEWLAEQLHKD